MLLFLTENVECLIYKKNINEKINYRMLINDRYEKDVNNGHYPLTKKKKENKVWKRINYEKRMLRDGT